MEQKQVDNFTI